MTGFQPRNEQERADAEIALRELLALDATQPRPRLADRVRGDPAARAARFLTLATVYAERRRFEREQAALPANVYPAWTYYRKPTIPRPKFPEAGLPVDVYVAQFNRMNRLQEPHA